MLDQEGKGTYGDVIQGIEWAIDNDMDIISMSLGGNVYSQAFHEAVKEANSQGIIIVAAAGNNGYGEETELYPARYPEVVSVGAITPSLHRADFSSTGHEIDLMAPGTDIVSTTNDGDYGSMSGTSMAAPHVTGAVAVLLSEKKKKQTTDEVRINILETATIVGQPHEYGNGVVHLTKALGLTDQPIQSVQPDQPIEDNPSAPDASGNFDINNFDVRILPLNDHLISLSDRAREDGDHLLAKEIEQVYNDLLSQNLALHQLPNDIIFPKSESDQQSFTQVNEYYVSRANEFITIESAYIDAIVRYSGIVHGMPTGEVTQQSDSWEPNNSQAAAYSMPFGIGLNATIHANSDVDYYKFTASQSGSSRFLLLMPSNVNYNLHIFDSVGNTIASGSSGVGISEDFSFPVVAGRIYYAIIYGVSGSDYSSSNYNLVTFHITAATSNPSENLVLNTPVDVSLSSGQNKVFQFTPSSSGNYKIFTGPYGGYGGSNDTYLEMYSNSSLTTLVGSNDDSNGTLFSELKYSLSGGSSYYIKLRSYNQSSGSVYARLTASQEAATVTPITLNSLKNVSVGQGQSLNYSFTPSTAGIHRFYTYALSGDTTLTLYSDPNFSNQLMFNDDFNSSLSSEISYELVANTTYYIKYAAYGGGSVSSGLTVSKNPLLYVGKVGGTPTNIDDKHVIYYPNTGKIFVNLFTIQDQITGLSNGNDYIIVNEEIWLSSSYLSTLSNMITTASTTQVKLDIWDQVLISYVDNPPPVGVASTSIETQGNVSYPSNMCTSNCDYSVVLLGGMLSRSNYFNATMPKLVAKYASVGKTVGIVAAFPYGTTDNVTGNTNFAILGALQLVAIKLDMDNSVIGLGKINAASAANIAHTSYGGKTILIGHSGGGIAAYRGAQRVREQSNPFIVSEIVTVGSPKTPVESYWQSEFTYVESDTFFNDPVTAFGWWGLFNIYKPNNTRKVKLNPAYGLGGFDVHVNYFYDDEWTANNVLYNNIDNLINTIWNRIQ